MSSDAERRDNGVPGWVKFLEQAIEPYCKKTAEEFSKVWMSNLQNVPEYMAARVEFEKFYVPQLIAIGPRQSEKKGNWILGEPYKYKWTAMYLNHTNQTIRDLHIIISRHQDELFQTYHFYIDGWRYDYDSLNYVLDGCSILQVLEKSNNSVDAEQELEIRIDKLVQVHQDLLILDNQIPFQALRVLCNDEARFEKCLQNFLEIHGMKADNKGKEKGNKGTHNRAEELKVIVREDDDQQSIDHDEPVHLLDYLRRALLMRDLGQINKEVKFTRKSLHLRKYRIGTIRELKAAGIHVKKGPNNAFYPSFSNGTLYLPELTVDGSTAHIFLNLIAYEMCPDFSNKLEITSYIVFMSSLIDQPEDVKELRSARVLINELANDKQVANLFNKMDSVLVPETPRFAEIRDQIHNHFESKPNKIKMLGWLGEAYETFLRSPWTVIALLAGSLGLVLTFIQTWFAIHPKGY